LVDYAVVYLARSANDPRHFRMFLNSLRRYRAGRRFDLIVIAKGFATDRPHVDPHGIEGLSEVLFLDVDDSTFATNAFFMVAEHFSYPSFQFHVSWSRPCAEGWLGLMAEVMEGDESIGLVGGSGGYEQLNSDTPFPNPNIRTTGFLIRQDTFLSLDPGPLARKYDGNLFEAGPCSMTRQIVGSGKRPVVVGRDGRVFDIEDWPISETFRSGSQSNLLLADNRTQDYAFAGRRKRERLARLNYGDGAVVYGTSFLNRLIARMRWRFLAEA
jgi:hypothetical protein